MREQNVDTIYIQVEYEHFFAPELILKHRMLTDNTDRI